MTHQQKVIVYIPSRAASSRIDGRSRHSAIVYTTKNELPGFPYAVLEMMSHHSIEKNPEFNMGYFLPINVILH
jgi:hypothetical protein